MNTAKQTQDIGTAPKHPRGSNENRSNCTTAKIAEYNSDAYQFIKHNKLKERLTGGVYPTGQELIISRIHNHIVYYCGSSLVYHVYEYNHKSGDFENDVRILMEACGADFKYDMARRGKLDWHGDGSYIESIVDLLYRETHFVVTDSKKTKRNIVSVEDKPLDFHMACQLVAEILEGMNNTFRETPNGVDGVVKTKYIVRLIDHLLDYTEAGATFCR